MSKFEIWVIIRLVMILCFMSCGCTSIKVRNDTFDRGDLVERTEVFFRQIGTSAIREGIGVHIEGVGTLRLDASDLTAQKIAEILSAGGPAALRLLELLATGGV